MSCILVQLDDSARGEKFLAGSEAQLSYGVNWASDEVSWAYQRR